MKNTRPRLVCALRTLLCIVGPALLAASTGCMMLEPANAWAAARSHTHHSSSRPLPSSSFVETSSRAMPKRKGNSHKRSMSGESARSGSSSHQTRGAKASRGHSRQRTGPGGRLPMDRAVYSTARGRSLYARNQPRAYTRRSSRYQRDTVVAEVAGRSRRGDYIARLHASSPQARGRYPSRGANSEAPVVVAALPQPARSAVLPRGSVLPTNRSVQGDGASGSSQGVYAEGISEPDADEVLPRRQPSDDGAVIGTAQAMAAPQAISATTPRAPQTQVVPGFGGELAIASPGSTDRPGGTRRRNHPIPGSALPEDAAPSSLEEREAITDAAVRPAVLPEIYDRSGRLVMPAPLRGSREVLVHQNTMAANEGLERIQDDGELDRLRAEHQLVSFPVSESLRINEDLPNNRRYARPWTVLFAQDIARDFYARFRQPLQVNSAVRTVSYQLRLQRVNGNAAAIDGDGASPHLTGQAIDLGKRGMSSAQLAWMRAYLLPLMQAGKIDVEEEFQQACFHISVYRRYTLGRRSVREVAQVSTSGARNTSSDADADQP